MIEENLLKLKIKLEKRRIVADIVLIFIILCLATYIVKEIELFKALSGDVCKLCEAKTGAVCYLFNNR